jgi:hypothetical protein
VLTLASVAALQTASHPFLLQHLLFSALALAGAALWLPPDQPASWPAVLLASLLAMAAVLTQANGISLPFALLLLEGLARRRMPDPWRAALLLLPALLLFAYFYLLRDPAPMLGQLQPPGLLAFLDFLLRLAGAAAGLALGSEALARPASSSPSSPCRPALPCCCVRSACWATGSARPPQDSTWSPWEACLPAPSRAPATSAPPSS